MPAQESERIAHLRASLEAQKQIANRLYSEMQHPHLLQQAIESKETEISVLYLKLSQAEEQLTLLRSKQENIKQLWIDADNQREQTAAQLHRELHGAKIARFKELRAKVAELMESGDSEAINELLREMQDANQNSPV